jgi:hypothetical protein
MNHLKLLSIIVCLTCTLVISCSKSEEKNTFSKVARLKVQLFDTLSTEQFVPDSYIFSSVPKWIGNKYWIYFDEKTGAVHFLDEKFRYLQRITVRGNSPKTLRKVHYVSPTKDYLFILGSREMLIIDINTLQIINKYTHNFTLSQQVFYYNQRFVIGYLDKSEQQYIISSFQFDKYKIKNIETLTSINFEKGIDITEYSGWFGTVKDYLVFIKDWRGEMSVFDKNFQLVREAKLPMSGDDNFNKQRDGTRFSSYYFEAYSISEFGQNIAVMRELDFEKNKSFDPLDIDEKYVRKRIHILNENIEIVGSIQLPIFATDIFFKKDTLLTLNYEDENVYVYKMD